MNKFKKVIILALIVVVLSGCKINSEVEVKEDGKVTENITIVSDIEQGKTIEDLLNYIDAEINNYNALIKYGGYKYEVLEKKDSVKVIFSKTHDSICLYFQNTIFNQYEYKHVNCLDDGNYIIIENDTLLKKKCIDCLDDFDSQNVDFILKLPKEVKALENNADIEKDNTYIWKFDEDTPESKSFKFKVSKRDLETAKENYEKNQERAKKNEVVKIVVVILVITCLLIFMGHYLYNKYKNNKLEY